jgi:hypothetical protein
MASPLSKKARRERRNCLPFQYRCVDCARKLDVVIAGSADVDSIEADGLANCTELFVQKLVDEMRRNLTDGDVEKGKRHAMALQRIGASLLALGEWLPEHEQHERSNLCPNLTTASESV